MHTKRYPFRPALYDMDAAGVLFFGHLFRHLHDAYESLMTDIGQPLPVLLEQGAVLLPITHSEADYRHPIRYGMELGIELAIPDIGEDGFDIVYRILDEGGALYATARTRHVCIAAGARQHHPLPERLRRALQDYSAG